jgi:hypothetical protein
MREFGITNVNSADLLGVSAAEPGFDCVRICPNLESGKDVVGTVPIPDGSVRVEWHSTDEGFSLFASVPVGKHLQVCLPARPTDLLFIDGEPIAIDTQTVRGESSVELAVLPGNDYHFTVRPS